MKATFKNVAIAIAVLAVATGVFAYVDSVAVSANSAQTCLKVTVVDLEGNPLHDAQVKVGDGIFYCDNKGRTAQIQPSILVNSYDSSIDSWYTAHVVVQKDGYVPSVVVNCVLSHGQTRQLTVRMYPLDGSELPFVIYVERPPSNFVKDLLSSGK